MTVMPLNHANACAHLHSKRVYVHAVVEQRKRRIGVTEAVKRSVLPCTWACNQPCVGEELAEGLVDVLGDSTIRQSEHRQIHTLLEQVFKRDVLDVVTALVDALELVDGATAADDIPTSSFTCDTHL